MTTTRPEPYSRWRLTDMVDRLASSYDSAARAIDTFSCSAVHYDPMTPRPTARERLRASLRDWVARRGWPRATWFAGTCLLIAWFMAFISVRLLHRFPSGAPPVVLAAIPGLLLTLALVGSALLTTRGVNRPSPRAGHQAQWPPSAAPRALFAACLAGSAAWVAWWISAGAGLHPWAAAIIGVASAALAGAVLLIAGRPVPLVRPGGPPAVRAPAPTPRQLRVQQRRAGQLMYEHSRGWSIAAHQCGVAVAGSPEAEVMLRQLLSGSPVSQPLSGFEVFHAQLLATLSRYRPDPLRQRLNQVSRSLLPDAAAQ